METAKKKKMATGSSGCDISLYRDKAIQNLLASTNVRQSGTANDFFKSNLLKGVLNCENSMDKDDFATLFTSQTVSTLYKGHPCMRSTFVSQTSPVIGDNECHTALNTIYIKTLKIYKSNLT